MLEHHIDTGLEKPIALREYRRAPSQFEYIEEEVKKNLKLGAIEPCISEWAAQVVLAKRKDGKLRFCINYQGLNAITKKCAYLMPRVDETLDSLAGCKWFSALDAKQGFWHVPLAEEDRDKTAFRTRSGQYRWRVMPFGLVNAPATFQRFMDTVLMGLTPEFALVYIDDVVIFTKGDFDDHLAHLERVMQAFEKRGPIHLSLTKCQFAKPKNRLPRTHRVG